MSIVDKKYAEKYKNSPGDWLKQFLDERVQVAQTKERTVKNEGGPETKETVTLKTKRLDVQKVFDIAKANNISTEKMEATVGTKNAAGRIRMTLGNELRAAAKHRHGLFDAEGTWHDAPADFIGDQEKTHERDGTKIPKAKPEAEAA